MRIALDRGRDFTDADREGAPGAVIVNQFMAEHWWPGEDPIGKRISLTDPSGQRGAEWHTIVGVTRDVVRATWTDAPEEEMYLPLRQVGAPDYLSFVVRASCGAGRRCDASALAPAARRIVAGLDRGVPVSEVITMDAVERIATARPRFYLVLLAAFAGVALVLAAVGIYGVTSYAVSRRTHEIGLRLALGAEPGRVLRQVLADGLTAAGIGAAAGALGALGLTRLLRGVLYGVQPRDPVTFVAVVLVLAAASAAASWIPARRATRVEPVAALRGE
jgi:putative ABC transport system permease protein